MNNSKFIILKKRLIALNLSFFMAISLISCKKGTNVDKNKIDSVDSVYIEVLNDSIFLGEDVKCLAILDEPYFKTNNSRILVFIQIDDSIPLLEDLSNRDEVSLDVYYNLSYDTINQRWLKEFKSNFDKTAVFGRKFFSSGENYLRGYILEYISDEAPIDTIFNIDEVRKYYFENKIFVKTR